MSNIVRPENMHWYFQTDDVTGAVEDIVVGGSVPSELARYTYDSTGNIIGLAGAGSVFSIGRQFTQVAGAADTNENTLYTLAIAAGTMGANDMLRIWPEFSYTASTNLKTLKLKFGSTAVITYPDAAAGNVALRPVWLVRNRNSVSSQLITPAYSGGVSVVTGIAPGTGTIDFSAAQTLTITGEKATGGELLALESVLVELIRAGT